MADTLRIKRLDFQLRKRELLRLRRPSMGGSAVCIYPVAPSRRFAEHIALSATMTHLWMELNWYRDAAPFME